MYKKPQLQMKNICYCYDGKNEVLKNVNLDIFAGEKIAIMGANGAGKSTLFLCMNGVLFTEKGDMIWEGEKIIKKNRKQLTKNVGIVFQEADNQIIAPTVLEEISFGPMNLKLPQKEVQKRVYSAMEKMGLTSFENRITHYLSGGEKKKVTIADCIAMESKMILFDEPHTALDPFHQQVKSHRVVCIVTFLPCASTVMTEDAGSVCIPCFVSIGIFIVMVLYRSTASFILRKKRCLAKGFERYRNTQNRIASSRYSE